MQDFKRNNVLIGVSGKISSGKDTVGIIIRQLTSKYSYRQGLSGLIERKAPAVMEYNSNIHSLYIKKYADSLKDIICILIGCSREQLEDSVFKETPLGEDWRVWFILNSSIRTPTNFYGLYTSKEEASQFLSKNFLNPKVFTIKSELLTPRKLLQLMGTECGRNILHPNIWINALYASYKPINNCTQHSDGLFYTDEHGENEVTPIYPNWVITDMRFPNELEALEKRGGISIRVNRLCYDSAEDYLVCHPDKTISRIGIDLVQMNQEFSYILGTARKHGYIPLQEQHPSETGLDDAKFDYVIDNRGNLEDLVKEVEDILIKEKVL